MFRLLQSIGYPTLRFFRENILEISTEKTFQGSKQGGAWEPKSKTTANKFE